MSLSSPKVSPPAQPPAPAAMGADALKLGSDNTVTRTPMGTARSTLRVGSPTAPKA